MCIIGLKPHGVKMPTKAEMRACFTANRDGAGIAVVRDGTVKVYKGFMQWGLFEKAIDKLDIKPHELAMIHFRWGTAGENNRANTHPFPVWPSDKHQLRWTSYNTRAAMSHNGILGGYSSGYHWQAKKVDEYSDTQEFVYDHLRHVKFSELLDTNGLAELEAKIGSANKLAIVTAEDKFILVNEASGVWDSQTGMWWSNSGYRATARFMNV